MCYIATYFCRMIPQYEHEVMSDAIYSLLHCDINSLPTEQLTHTFWKKFSLSTGKLKHYHRCLSQRNSTVTNCADVINTTCPHRFGFDMDKTLECHRHFVGTVPSSSSINGVIERYRRCLDDERIKAYPCMGTMTRQCRHSHVRSTKTVRLTMDGVQHLLARDKTIKVIHLIRDPRAVVLSREQNPTFHGLSGNEANIYCESVVNDVIERRQLEAKYPNNFLQVIYDDVISHPIRMAEAIYSHIQVDLPDDVVQWLQTSVLDRRDGWRDVLTSTQIQNINAHCKRFFEEIKYNWK